MKDSAYGNCFSKTQTAYINMICILLIKSGFTVLTPYYCIFPMACRDDRSQVKGFMSKNNTIFKLKHVKVLVESSVVKVTACRNGNIGIDIVKLKVSWLKITQHSNLNMPRCWL